MLLSSLLSQFPGPLVDLPPEPVTIDAPTVIPAGVLLRPQPGARIQKAGSGRLAFLGRGLADPRAPEPLFVGFAPGEVSWQGPTAPLEASSELFDTGDDSQSARVELLTAALDGHAVTFHLSPLRAATAQTSLRDRHSLRFLPGVHQNRHAQTKFDDRGTYEVGSDCEVYGSPGAVFMESDQDWSTRLLSIRYQSRHVTIRDLMFQGQGAQGRRAARFDGVDGGIVINNGEHCTVRGCHFDRCGSYVLAILNASGNPGTTRHCSFRDNYLYGSPTQVLFIADGDQVDILGNTFDLFGHTASPSSTFAALDIEPNKGLDRVTNLRIEGNRFDFRGHRNEGYYRAIYIQAVDTAGIRWVWVRGNTVLYDVPDHAREAISLFGVADFEVSGNYASGIGRLSAAVYLQRCRRGRVHHNTAGAGSGNVVLIGSADVRVEDNRHLGSGVASIREDDYSRNPIAAAEGGVLTCLYPIYGGPNYRGNVFEHELGLRCRFNGQEHVITAIRQGEWLAPDGRDHTAVTLDRPPVGPTGLVRGTVDPATETVHAPGHGLPLGALVHYDPSLEPIGGLPAWTEYWVIPAGPDAFRLAATYEDAQAGKTMDLTGIGTGDHDFYPCVVIYSDSNTYARNDAPDGVILAPGSRSAVTVEVGAAQVREWARRLRRIGDADA